MYDLGDISKTGTNLNGILKIIISIENVLYSIISPWFSMLPDFQSINCVKLTSIIQFK